MELTAGTLATVDMDDLDADRVMRVVVGMLEITGRAGVGVGTGLAGACAVDARIIGTMRKAGLLAMRVVAMDRWRGSIFGARQVTLMSSAASSSSEHSRRGLP